ncbi:MAG: response regulator [Rubellimicrobium sp.]|nr:response regulator [Rubellimicrobium sp.]
MTAEDGALILWCADAQPGDDEIAALMRGDGYRVVTARTLPDLLDALVRDTPDLILCDTSFPGLDSFDDLSRFRREFPHLAHVPLILISEAPRIAARIEGKRAGADDYLSRGTDPALLLSTLAARLRQSARARAGLLNSAGIGRNLIDLLSVGVLVFDTAGSLIEANAPAQAALDEAPGPILDALADPVRTLAARAAREDRGDGGEDLSMTLLLDEGAARLAQLHACPAEPDNGVPAMVMAFVTDATARTPLTPEALADLFSLTPTEARVARHLAGGLRADEIAQEMGIAPTTIAFHLRNIFGKTGTHRQADLVALLLSLPLRSPD